MNAPLAPPAPNTKPIEHGGNLDAARKAYPDAPLPWIDLSTGINPKPWPRPRLSRLAWERLPEPAALTQLQAAAARYYAVSDPGQIVAGPGTQALIQWLAELFPGPRIGILGFTYGEYAHVWAAKGADVCVVDTPDDLHGFDLVIVVNPNNPDGRRLDAAQVSRLCLQNALVLVDEAFIEMSDGVESSAGLLRAGTRNLVVLRSFGKTFGLAGLRLGFALADGAIAARLRTKLGPWAVSGPAIELGVAAFEAQPWLARARVERSRDARRLDRVLQASGFEIVGGTALFRLAASPRAMDWHVKLARAGILSRAYVQRPDWLRFGLPGNGAAWRRLEAELRGGKP
ncbi:MAG: threonine-phosphate decarboxylase [Hyphomicrobiales bacterium]|nr:threonine-phosphate decarboxylase [Hyphomicrobiales bacterium]MDE2113919.1 threonine-phosphate decarboxylase [Hyphomicrobiales bacterium]